MEYRRDRTDLMAAGLAREPSVRVLGHGGLTWLSWVAVVFQAHRQSCGPGNGVWICFADRGVDQKMENRKKGADLWTAGLARETEHRVLGHWYLTWFSKVAPGLPGGSLISGLGSELQCHHHR